MWSLDLWRLSFPGLMILFTIIRAGNRVPLFFLICVTAVGGGHCLLMGGCTSKSSVFIFTVFGVINCCAVAPDFTALVLILEVVKLFCS